VFPVSKYEGKPHRGPQRTAPYPLSRLAPPHDLVGMAEQIEAAHSVLSSVVSAELEAIARQIRALQDQAAEALGRAQRDVELHRARCRMHKRPGQIYHLYRDASGEAYLSLLSPDDWRGAPPHAFEGSYRLEIDMHWTPVAEIDERDRERAAIRGLLPR
jgi:hypothetical protein